MRPAQAARGRVHVRGAAPVGPVRGRPQMCARRREGASASAVPRILTHADAYGTQWVDETLAPVSTGAPYTCFLGRHEPASRVRACFGEHWPRLQALKRRYDPRNVFRHTFWPADEDGEDGPGVREPASP